MRVDDGSPGGYVKGRGGGVCGLVSLLLRVHSGACVQRAARMTPPAFIRLPRGLIPLDFGATLLRAMRWAKVLLVALLSREAAPEPQKSVQSAPPVLPFRPPSLPAFRLAAPPAPLRPPSLPPPPPSPPLQGGDTPLHWAAYYGHAPVVALLLATPGVDPLAKTRVRDAQWRLRGPACLPAPHHSALL